jgi:hypothetical protein
MKATIPLDSLLRDCAPGRLQSVGLMTVVPLVSDVQDERFAAPDAALVSTAGYGNLVFRNPEARPLLVPCAATYIVAQAAQNHALPHAGFVPAGATRKYDTAMCVQQSQGGNIKEERHRLMLLPFPLREKAHGVRRQVDFRRLWTAIAEFNGQAGLTRHGHAGHLEFYFQHYRQQLDTFVAQFEPAARQVGCVVLVGDRVVGVERTPSTPYFRSVWRPLIRECYGTLALLEGLRQPTPPVPRLRVPLPSARSLVDLRGAVREAEEEAARRVDRLLDQLRAVALQRKVEETEGQQERTLLEKVRDLVQGREPEGPDAGLIVEAVGEQPFVGEFIRDGERVVYASLIATEQGRQAEERLLTPASGA